MAKRIVLGVLLLSLLAGGGGYGWYWWTVQRFIETTDDAYVHADQSPIAAKVDGYVRRVAVSDNAPIKTGDLLAEIDDIDFVARLAQAQATVEARQAARATIDDQIGLQTRVVRQAEAQVAIARADLGRAESDRDRYAVLARENAASRQRFDYAVADFRKAAAQVEAAQAAVATERQRLEVLRAQVAEAEEAIRVAEAAARVDALDLDHTRIRAPIDGVVGNRTVTVGQYVRPGTQLMVVVPLADVYVVANYKETEIERMAVGQKATLEIDAFPGVAVAGRIDSLAPATGSRFSLLPPENATGNFTKIVQRVPVRIRLEAAGRLAGAIRPGMSVVVKIDTRQEGTSAAAAKARPAS